MKGVALKSSKQLPGLERDCPPPSAPAAVCCVLRTNKILVEKTNFNSKQYAYHRETVSNPKSRPTGRTVRNLAALRVNSNDMRRSFTDRTL